MATAYEVIDADGHITEEDRQLRDYMEAPYRNRQATIYPQDNWDRSLGGTLGETAKDAKSWLNAMDKGGVSTAVLYPTGGLGIGWVREPDFAVAVCKAWNNFVAEEFQKVSPRLKGVALVPIAGRLGGRQGAAPRRAGTRFSGGDAAGSRVAPAPGASGVLAHLR